MNNKNQINKYIADNRPIFLFDGVCNLCNGAVDFIIRHEKTSDILFASLQSDEGLEILKKFNKSQSLLDSSYIFVNHKLLEKSEAALFIAKNLKRPWSFVGFLAIFPTKFLNFFYDIIANNRYRLFGKKESCRIPTASEKARFL
jgi:predicted DCC family thiol-disulfide oxidoreductase YuxK